MLQLGTVVEGRNSKEASVLSCLCMELVSAEGLLGECVKLLVLFLVRGFARGYFTSFEK